jgi:hypothetical protein
MRMIIDYSVPEKAQFNQKLDNIDKLLVELPDDMGHGIAPSPAGSHLLQWVRRAR